ncbi:MAG TPA: prepilin peptidase [Pyrinomonadaceae bacterium]|nr:prepilin peptidase [Pyrinomonadaceae bacterium]
MLGQSTVVIALLFVPLAVAITYMDVRYRRIPNTLVLAILVGGLTLNTIFGGKHGLLISLGGFALAFGLMFFLHVFGTMGAGDVKLFAAIGAVHGISLVLPTLLIVTITGGLLAICKMVYARRVGATMFGVFQFFYGLLPGQTVPRFDIPADRSYTLPYAVPICFGSLVSFFLFHGWGF